MSQTLSQNCYSNIFIFGVVIVYGSFYEDLT